MNEVGIGVSDVAEAKATSRPSARSGFIPRGYLTIEAYDEDGNLKWTEHVKNLVVNEGLDHALDSTLAGGTQITTWYIGLTDGTATFAATDTLASHVGWTENTDYSEAARQTWQSGAVSGQSVDNSGTVASYSINTSTTVGGVFLASDSTKGGTTGTLFSGVAFGSDRSLSNGDTLEVTYTFTSADDGV